MADEVLSIPDDELEIMVAGPAPWINKFYVTLIGPVVRITFAEKLSPEKEPHFRSAISMMVTDAVQLRDLLNRMLADADVAVEKIKADLGVQEKEE